MQILTQILFFVGIFLVFYFFMIRPQQQKQKKQQNFIASLKKGDNVVTIGGLHGKIYAIHENTVVLEVDKNTKLTFEKSAISMEITQKLAKAGEVSS
ncbi:MAG: preprotein translocase subunit YajC [Microscillaceae bacterium]|nr:preprotein translocase subunit YajC [Microscillaceae bacterium]MDW8460525.1 preprotein translocase subunit YajC [Cytophagales bacterium]